MLVDPAQIAAPQGHAVAVEEIENLDGDFAAVVDADRGTAAAVNSPPSALSGEVGGDRDHFAHGLAQEEMIVRHFVDPAQPRDELEQPADRRAPSAPS